MKNRASTPLPVPVAWARRWLLAATGRWPAWAAALSLGLAACGGGNGGDPVAPMLRLTPQASTQFVFEWDAVPGAQRYELLESGDGVEPFVTLQAVDAPQQRLARTVSLPARINARYRLRACHAAGCVESADATVTGSLVGAIGYVKASNTEAADWFGHQVALSGDGNTLAVSAYLESSAATGVQGDQADNSAASSGAVYVFVRDGTGAWAQQAYVKASNTDLDDRFGSSLALSRDGHTLAVGAAYEDSAATGVDGDQSDNSAPSSGAVYVFVRDGTGAWAQQAYVKASNTDPGDQFGASVALSGNGHTLAVGAPSERSAATAIDGGQSDNSATRSGAAYVFVRNGADSWAQQAYVKASNTAAEDRFGARLALSSDGTTLAVGAASESSAATGLDGDQADDSAPSSGAVYVFVRGGTGAWAQQAYVKASNTGAFDDFGASLALSDDGSTLVVGAPGEESTATGLDGDQGDNSAASSGAVYVFVRGGTGAWAQQAYVKASNTDLDDRFGASLALSGDGHTLAVGAPGDSSAATGLNGDAGDDSAASSGAAYVFVRGGTGAWAQRAYVKASNTREHQLFGQSLAVSGDGGGLAVGAVGDASAATGLNGDPTDTSAEESGAVYLY